MAEPGLTEERQTEVMTVNIGPHHPATHGVLRLQIVVDGERIVSADPIIGYMHRGAEKLFEVRDYRQIVVLANRHDWLSAFANELGVVLAVEDLLGMDIPQRVRHFSMLPCPSRLIRCSSHQCRPSPAGSVSSAAAPAAESARR